MAIRPRIIHGPVAGRRGRNEEIGIVEAAPDKIVGSLVVERKRKIAVFNGGILAKGLLRAYHSPAQKQRSRYSERNPEGAHHLLSSLMGAAGRFLAKAQR